ncbi:CRTAC1 family protein [Rhodohalobacter sp. SW132]|uniref:CRTAC1 family protein n=1 Tax=Rhodohalobacter sp. SW132 TaxID=2293433 RepID=UPI0013158079|nr:CRTAC1 family protein [Rhodohalobacter sp. SW132]
MMVALLDSIAKNVNPRLNEYSNRKRVEVIRDIPNPDNPQENIVYKGTLAQELIYSGQTEEAIDILESLLNELESATYEIQQRFEENILDLIALAYLRLGEQQNCILNHSSDSCLFPIQGEGVHSLTHGSEMAIQYYERLLSDWQPDNMEYRWLLNIAYMTLGKHPDEVPDRWIIPAERFSSDYTINRFHDVAPKAGLADEMGLSGGSITEDFNNNGLIDIMASSWGLTDQLQYYENNGDGTFTRRTDEAGLTGLTGGLNIIHADYNNDGFADVLVLRGAWLGEAGHHPNSLLRNNGDGTFTDVTESSGILSFHPTQTAVWADFNNNGWLDLFIGNESAGRNQHPAELYLNNKDGTFRNAARQAGVAITGYIKGVTAGDYTNDGYQDLYISILDGPNILMKNNGPNREGIPLFMNLTEQAGVQEPESSFPTWFWDYNNNGFLDLFVSGYYASPADVAREYMNMPVEAEMPRLYRNNGDGSFTDVTSETGLNKVMYTMGSNFGDLDNDGYLDFYAGTGDPDMRSLMPNRMFRNIEGSYFGEVTASGGFGHLQKGHGVSFADLNNNGHQDLFSVIGGAFEGDVYLNSLFENPGNDNNWITLMFEGDQSNQFGVGNRIRIEIEEADSIRTIHRTVTTGGSFGASSLQLEVGLGKAEKINILEVYWPASDIRQEYSDLKMNQFYRIKESGEQPEPIIRTPFEFSGTSPFHHEH